MNIQSSEIDLPSEGEINKYSKNAQNIIKIEYQNNDNSNSIIFNRQGDIPFNKYFNNISINHYSNQNINNENLNNKENSFSIHSSSPAAPPLSIPNNNNPEIKVQKEEIEIKKPSLSLENHNLQISKEKNIKIQDSNNTQPIIINVKSEEKINNCKNILFLILFYILSITNNIIFYLLVSIIDKLRKADN